MWVHLLQRAPHPAASSPVSVVQALQSLREEQLLQAVSGLPAQQEVLRTLALLLTGGDRGVGRAVRLYLEAASGNQHFREKVGCGVGASSPKPLPFLSPAVTISPFFFYKNTLHPGRVARLVGWDHPPKG